MTYWSSQWACLLRRRLGDLFELVPLLVYIKQKEKNISMREKNMF
jgi:hypothetical protein